MGLILKLLKLLRIAWNPFLVSIHQPLARGYNQDCYLNYLVLSKLMKETNEALVWCHNLYQINRLEVRVHLISKNTQINVQHQIYISLSYDISASPDQSDSQVEDTFDLDHSGDELFAKFYAALDEINFFKTSPAGAEDPGQLSKATQYFTEALLAMQKSGRKNASLVDLADSFKSRGNEFMRSNQHLKAVELYTCAIALSRKNAIYYCNRAAAYTLINMNNEAIEDCLKSIEIDPNYSKAYSRLGSAYFALGNYQDALYKGYMKASELDPSNENVRQNIEVTKKKLAERRVPPEEQNTHAHQAQGSHPRFSGQTSSVPFNLFPPGSSSTPEFFANLINRGSDLGQQPPEHSININLNDIFGHTNVNVSGQGLGQTGNSNNHTPSVSIPTDAAVPPAFAFSGPGNEGNQEHRVSSGHEGEYGESGVRRDDGVHINLTGPEQAAEALRAVMQMFGPQMGPHEGAPRGPG
ncbi:small glutamine-rich tetratricopeptide repeat-containing protein 2 isoform X2 [Phragmites australis]|uniref:small glutamine-rich tetratricopeptide repeat-containing protein 2 isoform X2 n=1 Tax=Phragmites australis TaxID=29695 RepID=UPI002D76DCBC|nr:small glutamine-rich tetratricopeptide repeat-containing protein 2 isoform X2 [Phragmites australis]XP_062183886.1 small glutamine-rich tetratricopeptide repeat-containing protein 2 isoform X2 [Phragmites australis]